MMEQECSSLRFRELENATGTVNHVVDLALLIFSKGQDWNPTGNNLFVFVAF